MILREYFHRAKVCHFCDECFHQIAPGEKYYGTVIAMAGHITVMKRHEVCPVDPFEEEEELFEMITEWEEEYESEEFPLAA